MPSTVEQLAQLAQEQAGVLRRGQLRDVGYSEAGVRSRLTSGRWQAVGPIVVVTHNGPLSTTQARWAAVLTAGDEAALAGRTALEAAGLQGWEDETIHLLVPKSRHVPALAGHNVSVHETRRFRPVGLAMLAQPLRARVERVAIDAASWTTHPRSASGLLAAVVQQRLSTAERLLTALDAAGRIRHRQLLRSVLHDVAGGADALSEIDFGRLCRRYGLPAPRRQQVRVDSDGRRRYLDVELVDDAGAIVAVETDGALHLLVRRYWDDLDRANELVISGAVLLRFPSIAVRLDPERVADQVRRALAGQVPRCVRT